MNYIVVGTDCSGKTSLVNRLSEVLDLEIVKGSSFEHSQCSHDELFHKFLEMTQMENVIFDRFTYCNKVYATLYQDYAMLTDLERRTIEALMINRYKVIYLTADDETLQERLESRGDEYVNLKTLLQAKSMYEEELSQIKMLEVIKFNTSYITTDEIVNEILLNY